MRFSIIIPHKNYTHFLPRAIKSVLAQSNTNYELIIVDYGNEHCADLVTALSQPHPIIYSHDPMLHTVGAARNYGAKIATGDYLIFLDADDELTLNALHYWQKLISQHEGNQFFMLRHQTVDHRQSVKYGKIPLIASTHYENCRALIEHRLSLHQGAFAIDRQLFYKCSYPEIEGREDIPFFFHLLCHAIPVYSDDIGLIIHKHQHSLRRDWHKQVNNIENVIHYLINDDSADKSFAKLKSNYIASLYLSLFKQLYRAKQFTLARSFYKKAFKNNAYKALKFNYIIRYLFCFFQRTMKDKT